jgi:hypothetical protein
MTGVLESSIPHHQPRAYNTVPATTWGPENDKMALWGEKNSRAPIHTIENSQNTDYRHGTPVPEWGQKNSRAPIHTIENSQNTDYRHGTPVPEWGQKNSRVPNKDPWAAWENPGNSSTKNDTPLPRVQNQEEMKVVTPFDKVNKGYEWGPNSIPPYIPPHTPNQKPNIKPALGNSENEIKDEETEVITRHKNDVGPDSLIPPGLPLPPLIPQAQGLQTQGPQAQGLQTQGPQAQGLQTQGPQAQGLQAQGPQAQGLQTQGPQAQGLQTQGPQAQGLQTQGLQAQGPQTQDYSQTEYTGTSKSPVTQTTATPAVIPPLSKSVPIGKYVRFGFGSESGLAATYFNLADDNTVHKGFPGLNGKMGTMDDFNERFTSEDKVKECMLKYWKASNPLTENTISEPSNGVFRVPCNPDDTDTLILAFEQYKRFIENKKSTSGENSDAAQADQRQLDRIEKYLTALKTTPKQGNCIGGSQLHDNEIKSINLQTLYYSVLPKLFYLMYKHAQEEKGVLDIKPIFDDFEGLTKDTSEYLEELQHEGPFKNGDYDGVHGMAASVVELFNLLKVLFPDIYGNSSTAPLPAVDVPNITDERIMQIMSPNLSFLNNDTLSKQIIHTIQGAFKLYNAKQYEDAIVQISSAFAILGDHVKDISDKLLHANAPYIRILQLLADISTSNDPTKNAKLNADLMNIINGTDPNTKEFSDIDKNNISNILNKLNHSTQSQGSTSQVLPSPTVTPVTTTPGSCPPCVPTKESCRDYINEAKKELYREIIGHIQGAFQQMALVTNNIGPLKDTLNRNLNNQYSNDTLKNNKGIKEFDEVITVLKEYLNILNSNWHQWIGILEHPNQQRPPVAPRLSPHVPSSFLPEQRLPQQEENQGENEEENKGEYGETPTQFSQPPYQYPPPLQVNPSSQQGENEEENKGEYGETPTQFPQPPYQYPPPTVVQQPSVKNISAEVEEVNRLSRELRQAEEENLKRRQVQLNQQNNNIQGLLRKLASQPAPPPPPLSQWQGYTPPTTFSPEVQQPSGVTQEQAPVTQTQPEQEPEPEPEVLEEEKPSKPIPGYMRSTRAHNLRLAKQGYGHLPSGMIKSKYSGGGRDVSVGPNDIIPLIAEQVAWTNMNNHYNSLEPEYQKMLPEPEPAPIYNLTEPMHRYIDEYGDKDSLNEARDMANNMKPEEIEDIFSNDNGHMQYLEPFYKKALPSVDEKWIPIMVRADLLRNIILDT